MNTHKLKLDLRILLPEAPDEKDACVDRLITALEGKAGIQQVHLKQDDSGFKLCIHYDPNGIPLSRLEEIVRAEGAQITEQFGHIVFDIKSPRHARHADLLSRKIKSIHGVISAGVSLTGKVRIEFDTNLITSADLKKSFEHEVEREDHDHGDDHNHDHDKADDHDHNHGFLNLGERAELGFSLSAAALLIIGYLLENFFQGPSYFALTAFIVSYFFGGFFTVIEAVENLKKKRFEIDTLMLVAAIGAAFLGKWAEGSLLLVLFSLGHALEHYAMGRAKKAIEALAELAPKSAHVIRENQIIETPVSEIKIKDKVLIKPNERIPVDGLVTKGTSSVNQAPVTGESVPVDKAPEDTVFTGTINGSGALEVIVTKLSSDSTLSKIVKLVAEAQAEASPTEQFTKKLERYFVPSVLIGVVLLMFAFLVINEPFSESLYRAMAVLVAASPCALAISTPSAVLSGIARAGKSGVLIKSGAALENLGRLSAMAFDKTGTLTEGKPRVTEVITLNQTSEGELLKIAAAVEKTSDHPLAQAIVNYAKENLKEVIPDAHNVKSLTGKGIQAEVAGKSILVGKPAIFDSAKLKSSLTEPVTKLQDNGRTIIVVASGDTALGVFGVMDTPRESSKNALAMLLNNGVKKLIMLSGDHQKVADSIARQIGLTDAFGDLMPDDKVTSIKKLRDEYKLVAMVGDGVNDAPAMAAATVGIAMGAAGSDVALETADIALMTDNLNQLVFSVRLSRQASRIIKQNLWVSLGVVAFLIPATLFGLGIGPAVAMHEGSTLVVVFNALRLLMFRDDVTKI